MMVLFSFYVGNFGSYNETHVYQSLFGKGEVEPIGVLWHTRRTCLRALSLVRTLRKPKKLARKNGSREVVRRVKGAHSAPPSPTLLLTKQALSVTIRVSSRACLSPPFEAARLSSCPRGPVHLCDGVS